MNFHLFYRLHALRRLPDAATDLLRAGPTAYAGAVLIIGGCTILGLVIRGMASADTVTMIYLTGVVIAAARFGAGPSIAASLVSVLAFNFFFIRPYYSLLFYDRQYYVTFAVMLLASQVIGSLTAQAARHALLASRKEAEARNLYSLARGLSAARDPHIMTTLAAATLANPYSVEVRFHFDTLPAEQEPLLVEWVRGHGRVAGRDSAVMASATSLCLPLVAEGEQLGVMQLIAKEDRVPFTSSEYVQFETFASLIASALLRARRSGESENERLRTLLLSSISHDLRTPLTVLGGGLAALLRMRRRLPREAMDELTRLWSQFDRLQRFVENLLRMSALASNHFKLNRQPYLIQEIIGAAISHVAPSRGERAIRTVMTGPLPMVDIDGALVEQVLVNLLENAIQHTGDTGVITVAAASAAGMVRLTVSDDGPGLPDGVDVFVPFRSDRTGGTGLGLAICRGIITAHGGTIEALRPATGAAFTLTLPVEAR